VSNSGRVEASDGLSTAARCEREDSGKGEKEKEERGRRGGPTGGSRMAVPHARGELAGRSAARWWAAHGLKGGAG
jgi:hypothetical protein